MTSFLIIWCLHAASVLGEVQETLNPCRLLCHMEHSIDSCKIVESESISCKNFYWTDESKTSTTVDKVAEDEFVPVEYSETITLLRVGKGGCDKLCKEHGECIDKGSECKSNGVCLNLFWNRGAPVRENMNSCYQLSATGCEDSTPVLCAEEPAKQSDVRENLDSSIEGSVEKTPRDTDIKRLSLVDSGATSSTLILSLFLLVVPFFTKIAAN